MKRLLGDIKRAAQLVKHADFIVGNLARLAHRVATLEDARVPARDEPTTSSLCTQQRCRGPAFDAWCAAIGERPNYHRKLWEFVFIARALDERGMLGPGRRGLGFGVGEEPLPAAFAARGCEILATDQAPEAASASRWAKTAQFAASKDRLNGRGLCPQPQFDERVSFRPVDMNSVPGDLGGFDFCWSACALEHLGDLEAGLAFVERSVACLRPGGVAVHTTEHNLSSDDQTPERGPTVLYRRRDIEEFIRRLEAAGHAVAPMDWDRGKGALDAFVDLPPYHDGAHLRLYLKRFTTTSLGLIVTRGP